MTPTRAREPVPLYAKQLDVELPIDSIRDYSVTMPLMDVRITLKAPRTNNECKRMLPSLGDRLARIVSGWALASRCAAAATVS
jgi:hypothetical protein